MLEWCLDGAYDWGALCASSKDTFTHTGQRAPTTLGATATANAHSSTDSAAVQRAAIPDTAGALLSDLLDELQQRVWAQVKGLDNDILYWQADPGGNSCGATVWHLTRWLDVMSVRVIDGLAVNDELWFANGWAAETGYDPRGLGEGGLGVLSGYTIEEVLKVPRLSAEQLIAYQRQVVGRLRPQLLRLTNVEFASEPRGKAVMEARARVTGAKATFSWIKHLLIGCLQHVGEMAAIVAMHQRLRDAEAGR